jgi:lipoprotein-anchoring transpeptidase ErfK/SrfK
MIEISIANQTLKHQGKTYSISSAKNGFGKEEGSFCTPTGKFKVVEKIGDGLEVGTVLVDRVSTDEIYSPKLKQQYPDKNWILTHILWLDGVETHNQNTRIRYIYIHGVPDEATMGVPSSKGCIRMRNQDIIELFYATKIDEDVVIIKP